MMGDRDKMVNKIANNQIEHTVATSNGTSGSPIYIQLPSKNKQKEYYCIGLHSGSLLSSNIKYGTLLSSSLIKGIKHMERKLNTGSMLLSSISQEKEVKYNLFEIHNK